MPILPAAQSLWDQIYQNVFADGRFMSYIKGLGVTLQITICACILGIVIGLIVAIIKVSRESSKSPILKVLNKVCDVYLSIFRGTPVMVQLLIFSLVIFGKAPIPKEWVCVIAFGINSGAYVSETIRAGILAVDVGQMEAGRSLGLTTITTYRYIILPQALKNILPALCNEFIALLKETAIVSTIAVVDLTKAANQILSRTFNAFVPLITAALFYWVIVTIMNFFIKRLERRLRQSDKR
ncbi:amino acid ABC transporter permease [Solibaculum mannosilyticum]|uniref:Amino acid ABC transporter permease n=1 Tax=Solibaculum mannosilyticum TaxID=2780922 RepID=A0A7I8D287_9FIRM|nr:amino acid ABC transporter permease [Solibaculum mannosilyticum]BCI60928.1 amino acid ABC transporter permease [Solibaculum mannosilyticum]